MLGGFPATVDQLRTLLNMRLIGSFSLNPPVRLVSG
jgi:hypothetical protein